VGFLDWLLGKRGTAVAPSPGRKAAPAPTSAQAATATSPERRKSSPEDENLRRWRESGRPRAWVEAHKGRWDHDDWLALLEELKRSRYWPLQPDAVGMVLEDAKREWSRRN
jgi:hypothetical protein